MCSIFCEIWPLASSHVQLLCSNPSPGWPSFVSRLLFLRVVRLPSWSHGQVQINSEVVCQDMHFDYLPNSHVCAPLWVNVSMEATAMKQDSCRTREVVPAVPKFL